LIIKYKSISGLKNNKYLYLLNLDLDNEEFVTLTYADAEPLQVSAKTSKYTEYNNFWKQIGVNT
jgi:hypothetical protein